MCLPPNPFRNLQIGRAVTFLQEVREDPQQDGFKVEKDKCLMTEWLAANNLPQPRMVGPWRELPKTIATLREIANGRMPDGEKAISYPFFLKACHITQGVQHGTHLVKSQQDLKDNFETYAAWVRDIWGTVSRDWERPWAREAEVLYPMVNPGIMIVEGWKYTHPPPAEIKVEVIWGAAFVGFFLGTNPSTDAGLNGFTDRHCSNLQGINNSWFCPVSESVFDLAEKAAETLGADEIRIDIFVHPTNPELHAINEISLFSGHPSARYVKPQMGEAWLYGYRDKNAVVVADRRGGALPQPYRLWKGHAAI